MGFKKIISGIFGWCRDHKSDLKMWIGTTGVVSGTVVLCKEAIGAHEIIQEYREAKQELIEDEADKKDLRKLKMQTAGKVVLKMLPGTVLEASGLGSMWSGYSDVKTAFVGIGMAYSGLQEFIDKYRGGVREKYGADVDEELAYGFRTEEVVTVDSDGNEKTETVRIFPRDGRKMPSPYARYFCYGEAEGAERSFEYNGHFLKLKQELFTNMLRARRKLMLNDVYRELGIKYSKAGNHVGWIYDPEAPEGDNVVDLRIQVIYREVLDENGVCCGWERIHMIDPNVDGMVEDKMVRMGLMDE